MRAHLRRDETAGQFAVSLSINFCNIVDSTKELKTNVFPDIRRDYNNHKWICERAILAPRNNNAINLQIQQQQTGK